MSFEAEFDHLANLESRRRSRVRNRDEANQADETPQEDSDDPPPGSESGTRE